MQTCGCYRGRAGYPGGSGFSAGVTVSGQVIGTSGAPAANLRMDRTINGRYSAGDTDAYGRYAVSGVRGSDLSVAPRTLPGVVSTPPNYAFITLQSDAPGRNFTLRPAPSGER
jgi:hypothetical protein